MEDFLSFIKRNSYYVMLAIGVFALGALVVSYNKKMEMNHQVINLQEEKDKIQLAQDENSLSVEKNTKEEFQQEVISNNVEQDVPSLPNENNQAVQNLSGQEAIKQEDTQDTEETDTEDTKESKEKESLHFDTSTPMTWPVVGNVILPFSMDATVYYVTLDQYKTNPGIFIQTIEGTQVSPGAPGEVLTVQEESGYGTVVTIDLGDGYIAKYGQLKDVRVKAGDPVKSNTVLGAAASPSSFYKKEGCHVFFELLKDDVPQNPMEYLE